MDKRIINHILEHKKVIDSIISDNVLLENIKQSSAHIKNCYTGNGCVYLFGCGGSAADSQHIAAEFINKLNFWRRSLPAQALTTDTSILTAIGNDSSFDEIFSRQVEAYVNKNDVVIGISTSGRSKSVIIGLEKAKDQGAVTILFTGSNTDYTSDLADIVLNIPSNVTPMIQEAHIMVAHIICEIVEDDLFER
ncbi:SIS domain-containing protein [Methanoplanus limicola]|uniref:Phosphoheptose isomerase n=1 Tax=Methanoplanus limicola DSM 2279 TaxID=937775 RepID=H1YXB8_9EURY|nr:SIS domain-containing protein [Methanoplanus limicola]EHQ36855.1 phosphoheptose isomerase [Methanoplanus limicola DSM 2279]